MPTHSSVFLSVILLGIPAPGLFVDDPTPAPGQALRVEGTGCAPGQARLILDRHTVLAEASVEQYDIAFDIDLPIDLPDGVHLLSLHCRERNLVTNLYVNPPHQANAEPVTTATSKRSESRYLKALAAVAAILITTLSSTQVNRIRHRR